MGALEQLSPAQVADPNECHYISIMEMAPRTVPILGAALAEAAERRDIPAMATAAKVEAAQFVEQYVARCDEATKAAGRAPDCAPVFDGMARAWRTVVKRRPVVWLNQTVNQDLSPTSIEFASPFDLLGSIEKGWTIAISDGQSAYNQVPVAEADRKFLCIRCPVTGIIYRYKTLTMGLGPAVLVFAGIMAEIKKILAVGPAKAQGGLEVSGIIDDVAEATPAGARDAQRVYRQDIYRRICYTAQEAKSNDASDGTTGTYRGLDFDTNAMAVQISHAKLADLLRRTYVFQLLRDTRYPYASIDAFESFVGLHGWLAQCNPQLSLHRRGLYRALHMAQSGRAKDGRPYTCVWLGRSSSGRGAGNDDLDWLLARAEANRLVGQRRLMGASIATVATTCFASGARSPEEMRLQAALSPLSTTATATLSYASVSADGARRWASITNGTVRWHEVPAGSAAAEAWADELELDPLAVDFEQNGAAYAGKLVVCYTDNIGNVYRVNRGNARYGTLALEMLDRMYEAADKHGFEFVALWVPRSFNQLADLFSKCSTVEQAQAWASAQGLRFVNHQPGVGDLR
jgi:hypothetical protein